MNFGIIRLIEELNALNYAPEIIRDYNGQEYARITNFEIPAGTFNGRIVELAIPAPSDYPRNFGASIHILANPQLFPFGCVPNIRNIIASPLGADWQYWSIRFNVSQTNPTAELMTQINEVFRKN